MKKKEKVSNGLSDKTSDIILVVITALVLFIVAYPLYYVLVASFSNRDYPVVQAIVVILAFWVVLAGTIADVLNQRIDPRLRLGGDS